MLIFCSHCQGQNDSCPVCGGRRVALVSFGRAVFWRRNLSLSAIRARIFWRLARQIMEGLLLVYLISAITIIFYLLLFSQNIDHRLLARLGFTALIIILYFFYGVNRQRLSQEKTAPSFLPTALWPAEENEIWQKYSRFEKVNCAPAFASTALILIDQAAGLARARKQTFGPAHLFYLLIFKTEIKYYLARFEIDLMVLQKRLKKGLALIPVGSGLAKEMLEIFLLAYRGAIESGRRVVGLDEIFLSFFTHKNLAGNILRDLGLTEVDGRNLIFWSEAQKEAALTSRKTAPKTNVPVAPQADLNEIFKKIAVQTPFWERRERIHFSYRALLAAAKIHQNLFSGETTLDKIFAVLNSAAQRVRHERGAGALVMAEDVKGISIKE
ncbi:MAG: hypothetical protein PHT40_00115 [Patescibacteria group bacterium]|nr:hypothetical protein [Patescibacteria group bacterium]